ncbi:transcription factor elt-1-like [Drosophila kikkawai]|uniref:Transcription factor elt-1-like n=1 Tax=Drosophila kikkawai TaxID=30033 RepID=A0ABM4GPI5_DROKI
MRKGATGDVTNKSQQQQQQHQQQQQQQCRTPNGGSYGEALVINSEAKALQHHHHQQHSQTYADLGNAYASFPPSSSFSSNSYAAALQQTNTIYTVPGTGQFLTKSESGLNSLRQAHRDPVDVASTTGVPERVLLCVRQHARHPLVTHRRVRAAAAPNNRRNGVTCANCQTNSTPQWRRNNEGNHVCNACGLYFKYYNMNRPLSMKNEGFEKRKRTWLPNNTIFCYACWMSRRKRFRSAQQIV